MLRSPRDHSRSKIAQLTAVALLATGLAVATAPTIAQASPAGAGSNAAAASGPLPWAGTMTIEYGRVWLSVGGNSRYTQSGKAEYVQLQPDPARVDQNGWGAYFAGGVDAKSTSRLDSTCGDPDGGLQLAQTSEWNYLGDSRTSSSAANGGSGFIYGDVLTMREGTGGVHLLLHYASVNALTTYHCPNSSTTPKLNGYNAFSFHSGTMTNGADLPLVDDDPDPNHLVGTTTFAPGDIPGGPDYMLYEFTVTYDLVRTATIAPVCDDGLDNDGDGRIDHAGSDPGCISPDDPSEVGVTQCDNAVDDDGDGLTDYRVDGNGDPSCDAPEDQTETSPCRPTDRTFSQKFRAITDVPGPDIHWYTTTITGSMCERDGRTYINNLDADRHVEGGPVPSLINQFGWQSGTETPQVINPTSLSEGVPTASVRFQYNACFDVLTLLKVNKAKRIVQDRIEGPLAKKLAKMLRKAGLRRIEKPVREKAIKKFREEMYDYTKPSAIKSLLKQLKVPDALAGALARATKKPLSQIRKDVDAKVVKQARKGRYDGFTAEAASKKMVGDMFSAISNMTAFCGGIDAVTDATVTWEGVVSVTANGAVVDGSLTNPYLHPLMEVRYDGGNGGGAW